MADRRQLGYVSAYTTVNAYFDAPYGVATGGTSSSITVSSVNYTLLSFTTDATLTVTKSGLFDVFILAGGGGGAGGIGSNVGGGGGGAGGSYIQTTSYFDANQTIKIGAGGAAGGNEGGGSKSGLSACGNIWVGHSAGGLAYTNVYVDTINIYGISTGGAGAYQNTTSMVSSVGTTYNGYRGGNGTASLSGGAGGGASNIANGSASSVGTGGAGATGYDVSAFIGGSALIKGSGGGGGGGVAGSGGTNAGAGGAGSAGVGGTASANTACGGGGGSGTGAGGAGGSGIVYVRFKV